MIYAIGCNEPIIEQEALTQEQPTAIQLKAAAIGTKYFVAKSGNNADAGTLLKPFLTIQKGLSVANAGDTVFVKGGIYQEYVSFPKSGTIGNPIVLKNYAQDIVTIDAQKIRIYCVSANMKDYISIVGIRTTSSTNYNIKFNNCSNVIIDNCQSDMLNLSPTIEGIVITNSIRKSNYIIKNSKINNASDGICIWEQVSNVLIQNCETKNSYYSGISVHSEADDSIVSPHHVIIDGVYSHNNDYAGIGVRNTVDIAIRNSHIAYNGATGIQLERNTYTSLIEDNIVEYNSRTREFETGVWVFKSPNSTVSRNIIRGNQTGIRVWYAKNFKIDYNLILNNIYKSTANPTSENTSGVDFRESVGGFYNNVLYGNCASNSKLGSIHVFPEGVSNISIKNNIVMNDGSEKDMDFDHVGGSVVSSNFNLVYNTRRAINIEIGTTKYTWSAYKTMTKQDAHSVNADPKFISLTNGNYNLQSMSPAIDKGVKITGITTDYMNKIISGLRDIGAYEY